MMTWLISWLRKFECLVEFKISIHGKPYAFQNYSESEFTNGNERQTAFISALSPIILPLLFPLIH